MALLAEVVQKISIKRLYEFWTILFWCFFITL